MKQRTKKCYRNQNFFNHVNRRAQDLHGFLKRNALHPYPGRIVRKLLPKHKA